MDLAICTSWFWNCVFLFLFLIFNSIAYLQNGNFEEQPNSKYHKKTKLIGKFSLRKWEINGLVKYVSGGPQPDGMFFLVIHGIYAVRLGYEASISQTIKVIQGQLYAQILRASRICGQDEVLRIFVPHYRDSFSRSEGDGCEKGGCRRIINVNHFHWVRKENENSDGSAIFLKRHRFMVEKGCRRSHDRQWRWQGLRIEHFGVLIRVNLRRVWSFTATSLKKAKSQKF